MHEGGGQRMEWVMGDVRSLFGVQKNLAARKAQQI